MKQPFKLITLFALGSISLLSNAAYAAGLMPFIMGNSASVETVEKSLSNNGFELVGKYQPSANKTVLVVTNNQLKTLATLSKNGGFGVVQRIAVSKSATGSNVSYTNPTYMWNAYRMKGEIAAIQQAMEEALGKQQQFGADKGLTPADLREYHYKMMMPYFDDEDELAEHGSYKKALEVVEQGLKANRAGAKKIYRVDIPGSEMSVFGVALNNGEGADSFISEKIDGKSMSHAAHFPYELLVVGNEVIALNGKFRIAINWPSLSMMGAGSFMSISNAPDDIKAALEAVANNKALDTDSDSLL